MKKKEAGKILANSEHWQSVRCSAKFAWLSLGKGRNSQLGAGEVLEVPMLTAVS